MNNQQLKTYIKTKTNTLKNKLLKVIKEFPQGYDWNENHVDVAVNKLVENPELSTEQVINCIKRSYLCVNEKWFVDKEKDCKICSHQLEPGKCKFNNKEYVHCRHWNAGGICLLNKA
jgi:hypothetical protein